MNEIYKTKNGKTVIDALNGNNCSYHVSSDIVSDGKGGFSSENSTLYLNGDDTNVGALAHEMFHAYQDYNNRSGKSIFNEVEANIFSFLVLKEQCDAQEGCFLPPYNSPLLDGEATENSSEGYVQYYSCGQYLLNGNFNLDKFNRVVSGFLQYSKQNTRGKYNDGYETKIDLYPETLIKDFLK